MSMSDRLNSAVAALRPSAIREFTRLAAQTPGCVKLTLGEPDFDTPAPVCAQVGEALAAGETHYIENSGAMALRRKIAEYEREKNGLDYAPEDVIVTAGATEALFVALFGILNPGDEVIVPMPAFVLYERIIGMCRGVCVPLPTEESGFQIDGAALMARVTPRTKAVLLNSPNNPTGVVYDRNSLEAVRRAVTGREIFVVCDDVYRQLCYAPEYHSFAEYRELREQIIVAQSFSKPYAMTGWRMGYLLCDGALREKLALAHQFLVTSTPAPFQRACVRALEEDVSGMVAEYRARRDYVLSRLCAMGLRAPAPEGAFYVFPDISKYGLTSMDFCTRLLKECGAAVTPGSAFGGEGHVRLSYCCAMDALREGLDRLERFLGILEREAAHES